MGRSGNPVLSEEQKKKISMRGTAKRGGGGGGRGGPPGRGRGGGGPPARGGGGPPGGFGGGGMGGGMGGGPPQPGFAQARYGFFTNDMPSGPIGHVNKQFVDSFPPVNTPSASSVGGGDRPIRPPNGGPLIFPPGMRGGGGGEDANWVPVGPPRPLMESMRGPGGPGGPPSVYGGGGGGGPSNGGHAAAPAAARGSANGTISELFGKMVWKKMEILEDATEVDTLQNEIMDLIAKAVKKQQDRKTKEEEERQKNGGGGDGETIPYGRPSHNNGEPPAFGSVPKFGGYQPYQGPGFF